MITPEKINVNGTEYIRSETLEYIINEVKDCLRQSKVTHLGLTALDSDKEIREKTTKNECAITRRIDRCIKMLNEIQI